METFSQSHFFSKDNVIVLLLKPKISDAVGNEIFFIVYATMKIALSTQALCVLARSATA